MFVPGQLVVCIQTPKFAFVESGFREASNLLAVGRVYTIAEVYQPGFAPWLSAILSSAAVSLEEFPDDYFHHTFDASLFRPLSPRSISIVESLKAPVPGKVTEPA